MLDINKLLNAPHALVIQKIECVRTASELDAGATKFFSFMAKGLAIFLSKKPQEAGGVYSTTQEEWEDQNEAAESWADGAKKLGNPGGSRDQLYLKFLKGKIWPKDKKHYDIKSGETVAPNLSLPWPDVLNTIEISLMEWDVFTDDSLGTFSVAKSDFDNSASKQVIKIVTSEEEGSIYKIHLHLKENKK
ncbi:hypothetical protein WNY78_09120 [Psychroserpens sp. AS72]|uniref:hypothetical protein n=1 Tax=Psychroserpens sp. AS72 TaxID=3135775 RepID=UPI00318147AC